MICSGVYPFLTIYSPLYEIISGIVFGGQATLTEARLVKLGQMENNLQKLAIEEEISFQDFGEHRTETDIERAKLNDLIKTIRSKHNLVKADFEIALNLTRRLNFLFEKGTFAEKRLLCEAVLKRVYIQNGVITKTELNPPSALIACAEEDSGTLQFGSPSWIRTDGLA